MEENTDFAVYGTFVSGVADILKKELENHGIPVKVIYPGTNAGRETTGNAYFSAYDLMIRVCDYQRAEEIRKSLNIEFLKDDEPMPLPKSYDLVKNNKSFSKYFLIATLFCLLALLASSRVEFFNDNSNLFFILFVASASLFALSLFYGFVKEENKK